MRRIAAIAHGSHDKFDRSRAGASIIPDCDLIWLEESTPDKASSAKARSLAEWKRSSRFFSRQRRTTRSRPELTELLVSERSGGSSRRIALIVSAIESRWNAFRPDSIS